MTGSNWWGSRIVLVAGALALLAAVPAVLAAAGIRNPWALGGPSGLGAALVAVGAVWQDRYKRLTQRRDEQAFRTEDGCLVLADGHLPRVCDITDPVLLGVHKAAPADIRSSEQGTGRAMGEYVPAYVPRDIDDDLRERLAAGGFVLLAGDSTAGKTRAAFEAIAVTLADHVLICPVNREAVSAAVTSAAQARQCVLWLDDLEGYLGTGGLTAAQVGRLLIGDGHHRVIVATIRAAEQARIIADSSSGDDAARQALRDTRQVIDLAHPVRVSRMFSPAELVRARARDWDPRVAEALDHANSYGVAEYLAAGPALLRDWEDARHSSQGMHARGAALVTAAIDIHRAGHTSGIPRALLEVAHEHYLNDSEHARTPREPLADAWAWATRQRHATTALLYAAADNRIDVLDYLVDIVQRRAAADSHVPEPVVRAAIDAADPADVDSLAATAYTQGRFLLAEHAWRQAWRAQASNPDLGPENVSTLTSRSNLANALRALGRLEEAERHASAVLETYTRVLGFEHPHTLASRDNLALVLRWQGRLKDAEAGHRAVLDIRIRVLGSEHPHTLASRDNLAIVLRDQGRLEEAEAGHRAVLDIRIRVLGSEHPHTMISRDNLAVVLRDQGRLEEAEAGHRAVLDIRTRVLGPEHPRTKISRENLTIVQRALGRSEEVDTGQ